MSTTIADRSASAFAMRSCCPRVLFLALANNVGSERIIGEMAIHGAACAVVSPPGFYCRRTRFAQRRFLLPPQLGIGLANILVHTALEILEHTWRPDLIVPLDDISASLLRGLATRRRTSRKLRSVLLRSLGDPRGYLASLSRNSFQRLAQSVGVRVPASRPLGTTSSVDEAIAGLNWPVFVKTEGSCGGCGVSLVPNEAELRGAVASGLDRNSLMRRLRGWAKQLVWRAAGHFPRAREGVQVQQLVPGHPAMRTVAAWEGKELAGISFRAECVHPAPTGSSTVIKPMHHPEMEAASKRLVAALGVSGFASFDFVVDEKTGYAHAIELNPRPIATTHLGRLFGQNVCGALFRHLNWPTAMTTAIEASQPKAIAVFPKELERKPTSRWLLEQDTLHDVPWEDQSLIDAYIHMLRRVHPNEWSVIRRQLGMPDGGT